MALIKCPECGKEVSDKAKTCVNCGISLNNIICPECGNLMEGNTCQNCGYQSISESNDGSNTSNNNSALVGMILGLVSIIAWLIPLLGYPCTIVGIIFSTKGLNTNKRGMAIAGLVLSIIFLIFTFINSIAGAVMNTQY